MKSPRMIVVALTTLTARISTRALGVPLFTIRVLSVLCGSLAAVAFWGGPAASAETQSVTVRHGASVAGRMPVPKGARVVAWDAAVTDATASQPSRLAVVWVAKRKRDGRLEYETSVAWCETSCARPRRIDRRTGGTGWDASIAVQDDRAFVRFGPYVKTRWALLDAGAKTLAGGKAERWWSGGTAALSVAADGAVWAGSRTTKGVVWMQQLPDGAKFAPASGTVLATGADSLALHALGSGLAASWTVRPNADEGLGKTIWAAGAPGELTDPARQTVLSEHGSPATLSGVGASRTVVSWADAEVKAGSAGYRSHARAAWVEATGTQQPVVAASTDFGSIEAADVETGWPVNAFEPASGGLALCPLGLLATGAGAPFAPGFEGCPPTWRVKVPGKG